MDDPSKYNFHHSDVVAVQIVSGNSPDTYSVIRCSSRLENEVSMSITACPLIPDGITHVISNLDNCKDHLANLLDSTDLLSIYLMGPVFTMRCSL